MWVYFCIFVVYNVYCCLVLRAILWLKRRKTLLSFSTDSCAVIRAILWSAGRWSRDPWRNCTSAQQHFRRSVWWRVASRNERLSLFLWVATNGWFLTNRPQCDVSINTRRPNENKAALAPSVEIWLEHLVYVIIKHKIFSLVGIVWGWMSCHTLRL